MNLPNLEYREPKETEVVKKESIRNEVKNILKNSMLMGVPHMFEEKRITRKIVKIIILCACLVGFSIQLSQFLAHYYSYPTIVEHSMQKIEEFVYPSIVMCSKNPIYRSKFCGKFPDNCENYNTERMCYRYPLYCDGGVKYLKVPRKPTAWMSMNATDLKELGYNLSTFLHSTTRRQEVSNDTYYYKTLAGQVYFCYRKYFRGDNDKELYIDGIGESHYVVWNGYFFDEFEFNIESDETFYANIEPGVLFDIQSPFETQFRGLSLERGKGYHIYIDLEEEHLLPPPYATNCRNYTDEWLNNNKTGPRSQKICQEKCHKDLSMKVCGCLHEFFFFGNLYKMEGICTGEAEDNCTNIFRKNDRQQMQMFVKELAACKHKCRDDCLIRRFRWEMQEYDNGLIDKSKDRTYVYLSLKNMEVKVISHTPKIQIVEVFSNIGGYLGLWLGFCLVAAVDFLQSLLVVLFNAIHKSCHKHI